MLEFLEKLLAKHSEGDYVRGLFTIEQLQVLSARLTKLAKWLSTHKSARLSEADRSLALRPRFSEKNTLCIAYVDHVKGKGDQPPARQLRSFFNTYLAGLYSHVHILPHFPCPLIHPELSGPASRADGGFEPISYTIDPKYGTPEDLQAISAELMFDFVLNHLSIQGKWFQGFLEGVPEYRDFFVTIPPSKLDELDISGVFRPRPHHPVFSFMNSKGETQHVWCTFGATQADINIKNPQVFARVFEALVRDFVGQGASWIRLDAVGYLVKMLGLEEQEPRTSSFGIQETHHVIKAMNAFLANIAPSVTLVAEVNATQEVIDTYYGKAGDEAHMVYDFPAAPISLFATYTGNARPVLDWAAARTEHPQRIGLAFTSTHDGIGVLPMRDVDPLPDGTPALDFLLAEVSQRGAGINYKSQFVNGQQTKVPYEVCITWTQAILTPEELQQLQADALTEVQIARIADRFVASQSYVFAGPHCVPADYLGAIGGLLNDEKTFAATQHNRNKNRGQLEASAFARAITRPQTNHEKLVSAIFVRKKRLLKARQSSSAFSPYARCKVDVLDVANATETTNPVFSVLRESPNASGSSVLAITNSTGSVQPVSIQQDRLEQSTPVMLRDLLSDQVCELGNQGVSTVLRPYQVAWLRLVLART